MIPKLARTLRWTLPFDLAYLAAFAMVQDHAWLSYGILVGFVCLGIGAVIWLTSGRGHRFAPFFVLASPLLPVTVLRLGHSEGSAGTAAVQAAGGQGRSLPLRLAALAMLAVLLAGTATDFVGERVVQPALSPIEQASDGYLQRVLAMAAASYGTARAVDRTIAVAAEAQMGPLLATFKPGQFFKPIQDMAVRYSDVMVVVMASVGAQLVLTELGRAGAVPVFGSGAILMLMLALFVPSAIGWRLRLLGRLFLVLAIGLRLVVPAMAGLSAAVAGAVLDDRRQSAQAAVDAMSAPAIAEPSGPDATLSYWRQILDVAEGAVAAVGAFSDAMVEQFVQLLVVYAIETLALPLLTVLLFWRLGRLCVGSPVPKWSNSAPEPVPTPAGVASAKPRDGEAGRRGWAGPP